MRFYRIFLVAALLGCAHPLTKVEPEEDERFSDYHKIGIPAFADTRGQGGVIADSLEKALQTQMITEPIDRTILEQVLLKYKVGSTNDFDVEALEQVRVRTSVDAIIFGKMAPDWSTARIIMIDAKMGVPVFRMFAKPKGGKKVFATPEEVSDEVMRAIATLH